MVKLNIVKYHLLPKDFQSGIIIYNLHNPKSNVHTLLQYTVAHVKVDTVLGVRKGVDVILLSIVVGQGLKLT